MVILPAIDIIKGNCVRLTKGDFRSSKKYFNDPVTVAQMWESMGASWLHVVDLDGARTGFPENLGIAAKIKNKTGLKVEFGGGIRRIKDMDEVIASGMDRAIIGTAALEDRNFLDSALEKYKEKIIISVDFDSKGIIYTRGWQQDTPYSIEEFLPLLKQSGINEIIITNITKDGTLSGPDIRLIRKVLDVSGLNIIIAGGITCLGDIKKLKRLENKGVTGVIIGKALYEEKISLIEAINAGR